MSKDNEDTCIPERLGVEMWQLLVKTFADIGFQNGVNTPADIERMFNGFLCAIGGSLLSGIGKERTVLLLRSVATTIEKAKRIEETPGTLQ